MAEVVVFSSSKDSCGLGVLDVVTGSSVGSSFKNCIADAGTMCTLGSSESSYSGRGSCGDYIAVSQAKKPLLHVYQWGKPQPLMQCHVQEIVTSLGSDSTGTFLVGGTQKGWIHCWNTATGELINMWQAHYREVTRIYVTKNNQYIVSSSEDGTTRVWETSKVLDISERLRTGLIKSNILPFRSWCKHNLPVKDMFIIDSLGVFRVITVSEDKSLVIFDVFASNLVLQVSFPHPLESITCNPGHDVLCIGATNGSIYVVDMTTLSIGVTAAHSQIAILGLTTSKKATVPAMFQSAGLAHSKATSTSSTRPQLQEITSGGLPKGTSILEGHTKAVTSLCFSVDNSTLVSGSEDGTLRWWNVWTRQCIRECKPMGKNGITNALIVNKPEVLNTGLVKPYVCPLQHLRKYMEQSSNFTTDPNGHPTIVLGHGVMSNFDSLRNGAAIISTEEYLELKRANKAVSQSVEEADNLAVAAGSHENYQEEEEPASKRQKSSNRNKKSAAGDLGDFVSFSSTTEDVKDEESDKEEVISDLQVQLQLAQEKMALLEEQNSRWEEICKQLKDHIASGENEEDDDDSEEEQEEDESEEEEEEEVIEVPAKKQRKTAAAPVVPPAAPVVSNKRGRK